MATTYTKSLASDFGGSLNSHQLHDEIDADGGIGPTLLRINTEDDVVDIVFDATLSAGESTTLDSLVSSHTPVVVVPKTIIATLNPRKDFFKNTSYQRLASFVYDGTDAAPTISEVSFISHMSSGVTDYTIRMIALSKPSTLMFEATFSNVDEERNTVSSFLALPAERMPIEFQIKKTGGNNQKRVYVDSITIVANA